jgi:hypothetical protein
MGHARILIQPGIPVKGAWRRIQVTLFHICGSPVLLMISNGKHFPEKGGGLTVIRI